MKLKILAMTTVPLLVLMLFALHFLRDAGSVGSAQVTNSGDEQPSRPAIIDVTDEQLERAYAEADSIHKIVRAAISSKKPRYRLESERYSHLTSGFSIGNKGKTNNELSWLYGNTNIFVHIRLSHYPDETIYRYRSGLNGISMGEFYELSGIGDMAVLVKNVNINQKVTNVGLHFLKGRAWVSVYVNDWRRSVEKNEKELMELVRIIEPLVIARADIRDP